MTEPVAHETFDPYHKWLGISPKDQPPNFYRLLAIDLFESDADVISAAADKQMVFIRSFQTGKDAQLSQKILNEVAAARVCLLNAAKKAQYDGTLRARMAAEAAASGLRKAKPLPTVEVVSTDEAAIVAAEAADSDVLGPFPMQLDGSERSQVRKMESKKATILPLVALGAMLVVCAVAFAVVMSRTPETPVSQASESPESSRPKDVKPPHGELATQDNNSRVPASSAKAAPSKSSVGPIRSSDSTNAAKHEKPPEAGAGQAASGNKPDEKPSGEVRPHITPPIGGDPFADKAQPAPGPETPAIPAKGEKFKTPEELDKQLAAAKTSEDYQAVAVEALRAAGKAMDDQQQDTARQLILKSLVAARKSGDSKLIVKATRALTKPESIQEIFAEEDKQDGTPPSEPQPLRGPSRGLRNPGDEPLDEGSETTDRPGPTAPPAARRISVQGTDKLGFPMGAARKGTVITLQYDGGAWSSPTTRESINPDDPSQNTYRVAIVAKHQASSHTSLVTRGTAVRAYRWKARQDYDSLILRCHISAPAETLTGQVYYRMTLSPPGP